MNRPAPEREGKTYRPFGLTLATDFPFRSRLLPGAGRPDLTFSCMKEAPMPGPPPGCLPVYASPDRSDEGESLLSLYLLDRCDLLRFTGIADFYVRPERIVCHLRDAEYGYLVEIYLLGAVLSFFLERQGLPSLHASAVRVGDRAIAFLSTNKGGKSTLAAAFLQAGYPLLTDDVLPVEEADGRFIGRPGYPQMRLWPDQAARFAGSLEGLERVHPALSKLRVPIGAEGFGAFCDAPAPLACLYVPERRETGEGPEIEIRPLSGREALIELVRNSFTPRMVEAVGLQPARLHLLSRLIRQTPVRRLMYPSGYEHLSRVRDAILADQGEALSVER
jgi:hypothetical protein